MFAANPGVPSCAAGSKTPAARLTSSPCLAALLCCQEEEDGDEESEVCGLPPTAHQFPLSVVRTGRAVPHALCTAHCVNVARVAKEPEADCLNVHGWHRLQALCGCLLWLACALLGPRRRTTRRTRTEQSTRWDCMACVTVPHCLAVVQCVREYVCLPTEVH